MREPLQAIADFTAACAHASLAHWLFGGWAIDFHLGTVTRTHDDIDFLVWEHDTAALTEVLTHAGFILTDQTPAHRYFAKYQQRIEVSFLARTTNGTIITPGQWAAWPWDPDAFSAGDRVLRGVRCPVTSLESVLETKQAVQLQAAHLPVRSKDVADLARVQAHRRAHQRKA